MNERRSQSGPQAGDGRQAELDYLRGIACLMVVAFHYLSRGPKAGWTGGAQFPWAEYAASFGHLGVPLFFMISGYVIYRSAIGRTASAFAVARFWRLYPAYWAAIILTTIIVYAAGARIFMVSTRDLIWNFTMFQEIAKAKDVDGAYWSLLVEMIFYIHVFVAIKLGIVQRTYALVFAWLICCVLNLFLHSYWIDLLLVGKWGGFFAIGILCYKLREGKAPAHAYALLLGAVAVALTRYTMDLGTLGTHQHIELALLAGLVAGFILCISRPLQVRTTVMSRLFGNLTYPIYLLHENIGYILLGALAVHLGSVGALIAALVIVFGLSYATHSLIEKRLTKRLKSAFKKPLRST